MERAHHRATDRQQDHPPERELHRSGRSAVRAAREARVTPSAFSPPLRP
nr:hypothetical protein [Paraburkholderia bryophila]